MGNRDGEQRWSTMIPCPIPHVCGVNNHRSPNNCYAYTGGYDGVKQVLETARPISLSSVSDPEKEKFLRDGGTIKQEFWPNGNPMFEVWERNFDGNFHREGGPAYRRWSMDGILQEEKWALDGTFHREGGPAHLVWDEEGRPVKERWVVNGEDHRVGGPANREWSDGQLIWENWYQNGKHHREDGPSLQRWGAGGTKVMESWSVNGVSHREDGPSMQEWRYDGTLTTESWQRNGQYFREPGIPYLIHNSYSDHRECVFDEDGNTIMTITSHYRNGGKKVVINPVFDGDRRYGGEGIAEGMGDGSPAIIVYHDDGETIAEKRWFKDKSPYRAGGLPSCEKYDIDGNVIYQEWAYSREGDLPYSITYKNGQETSRTWGYVSYRYGNPTVVKHRVEGPAYITSGERPTSVWYQHGERISHSKIALAERIAQRLGYTTGEVMPYVITGWKARTIPILLRVGISASDINDAFDKGMDTNDKLKEYIVMRETGMPHEWALTTVADQED